jgi:hypothetical protein
MQPDFQKFNEEEDLRTENDFLKMKIMLEKGGHFVGSDEHEVPPEVENHFLNNILAFEEQFEKGKRITVFEKIGKPGHFLPAAQIDDSRIDEAWKELDAYMREYSINLDVCSPNISARELYRFATEELFKHETDDINLPGWSTNFIYDEFYPDPVYDNTRSAVEDCIKVILRKDPMEWTHDYWHEGLRLNERYPLRDSELKDVINRFKDAYDDLEVTELVSESCSVDKPQSVVTGFYSLEALTGREKIELKGSWKVVFRYDEDLEFWRITEVQIEGIRF